LIVVSSTHFPAFVLVAGFVAGSAVCGIACCFPVLVRSCHWGCFLLQQPLFLHLVVCVSCFSIQSLCTGCSPTSLLVGLTATTWILVSMCMLPGSPLSFSPTIAPSTGDFSCVLWEFLTCDRLVPKTAAGVG
jgi:hypothetical protein